MIGRAVEAWELPLLRRAERDGNRETGKVLELFNKYCKEFKDGNAEKTNESPEIVKLTKSEKAKQTRARNKAKKEADAEIARLKAEREADEKTKEQE